MKFSKLKSAIDGEKCHRRLSFWPWQVVELGWWWMIKWLPLVTYTWTWHPTTWTPWIRHMLEANWTTWTASQFDAHGYHDASWCLLKVARIHFWLVVSRWFLILNHTNQWLLIDLRLSLGPNHAHQPDILGTVNPGASAAGHLCFWSLLLLSQVVVLVLCLGSDGGIGTSWRHILEAHHAVMLLDLDHG